MEALEILELSIQVPCEKRLRMCFQDTYIAAVEAQLSTLSKPSHRRAAPARKRTEVWTAGDCCNYFSSKVRLEVGNGASKPSTWNETKAKKALTMRNGEEKTRRFSTNGTAATDTENPNPSVGWTLTMHGTRGQIRQMYVLTRNASGISPQRRNAHHLELNSANQERDRLAASNPSVL